MSDIKREFRGGYVSYNNGPGTKVEIANRVIDWFIKHQAFNGETIIQCDGPSMDAPELLASIADEVMDFEVEWDNEQ